MKVYVLSKLTSTKRDGRYKTLVLSSPFTDKMDKCIQLNIGEAVWMVSYVYYLKGWVKRVVRYTLLSDDIFIRGYSQHLLKCVTLEKAKYIILETHKGICGYHFGARTMAARILWVGYFWSTMNIDCADYAKRCIPCQKHDNLYIANKRSYTISSPHNLLQNREWIFLILLLQTNAKSNSC